ncbi:MAG TPA: CPBP family intramembrane glutamic endopeptidase [Ktedonobacterales bacterium]|nr:CPBP family intramembrane glutamic endopeptidase [Ktedonobacterales bacterium]
MRPHDSAHERSLNEEEPASAPLSLSTARQTWPGLRALILGMLAPFGFAVFVYARYVARGPAGVGLTRAHLGRDLALGAAVGVPMAGAAVAFKRWAVPGYRAHTRADHALQTTFFMAVNAPIEELFWRGMVQKLAIQGAERIVGPGARANAIGWALTTLGFGAFHTIGGAWPWRAVIGATAGGGVFGLVYLLQPQPRSIVPSILVHGFAGSGFFNWGDAILRWSAQRAGRRGKKA